MAEDIVPALLEKIRRAFISEILKNERLKKLLDKLEAGEATYADANEQAIEVGEILARVLADAIKPEDLPNGTMYYNIAERILDPTLKTNHQLVTAYASDVQRILNEKAGLHIKPQIPAVNQERIDGLVNRISSEPFKIGKWLLSEPVVNFSQSIVDDLVKENADFQYKAGLQPKVIRRSVGGCCDWCDGLVGTYNYPYEVPEDVWRRHRYCRCVVEYDPANGAKRRNVHTKRVTGSDEDRQMRMRQYNRWKSEDEESKAKKLADRINFFAGEKNKVLPAELKEWIGDNKYKELIRKAEGEEAKKYVRTAYRKSSIIGDGGTVDVRRFELTTGRNLGRNGRTHAKKVDDLVKQVNKSLTKEMGLADREFLESELEKLLEVQGWS